MQPQEPQPTSRPLLGIGSCLAGDAVRYDGQTKAQNRAVRDLCAAFDTRAFCPEMGIGLGVPRPPIHLMGGANAVRVVDVDTHRHDYTAAIADYARQVLAQAPGLCGYILVKGSPSCGYGGVKRYSEAGRYLGADQNGIFTNALAMLDPLLPLEDDERLNDPGLRESFVTRVCTYHAWKRLLAGGLTAHRLSAFYSRYKYLVMAHHVGACQDIGRLLADAGGQPVEALGERFIVTLMDALRRPATRRSHSNVL